MTLIIALMCSVSIAKAQKGDSKEKIKQLRVAFYTEELNLSVEEAQKFWPIFNKYSDQLETLERAMKEDHRRLKRSSELTTEMVEEHIKNYSEMEASVTLLKKEFHLESSKVLDAKRTFLLTELEKRFRKTLLRDFRGRQ